MATSILGLLGNYFDPPKTPCLIQLTKLRQGQLSNLSGVFFLKTDLKRQVKCALGPTGGSSRKLAEAQVSNFSRVSNVLHGAEAVLTSKQFRRKKNHHSFGLAACASQVGAPWGLVLAGCKISRGDKTWLQWTAQLVGQL